MGGERSGSRTRWRWDTSSRARIGMVVGRQATMFERAEAGDKRLRSTRHGWVGTSSWTRKGLMEAGDKRLGRRRAVGLERTWWRVGHKQLRLNWHSWVETSSCTRKGPLAVEAGDEWLCSNRHGWVGDERSGSKGPGGDGT